MKTNKALIFKFALGFIGGAIAVSLYFALVK